MVILAIIAAATATQTLPNWRCTATVFVAGSVFDKIADGMAAEDGKPPYSEEYFRDQGALRIYSLGRGFTEDKYSTPYNITYEDDETILATSAVPFGKYVWVNEVSISKRTGDYAELLFMNPFDNDSWSIKRGTCVQFIGKPK